MAQNCLKKATIAWIPCCGSNWRISVAWKDCHWSNWGSSSTKHQVFLGVGHLEGLVGSWRFCSSRGRSVWFFVCWFHFLNCTWEVESYHSNSSSHVYPDGPISLGKCGRRVLHIDYFTLSVSSWAMCMLPWFIELYKHLLDLWLILLHM